MAKSKKRKSGRNRLRNITVNVNLPKGSYGRAGSGAAGILFANPVAAVVIAVAGIAIFMVVGGLSLPLIIEAFMNPWMWVLAVLITLAFEPKSNTVIMFAILVGLLFWGYDIYVEYLAFQQICSIPIIGPIVCGGWNIVTFIPKLFSLGLRIMVSFAMIWIGGFIRYQLEK